ncbi:MAG: mechanosensitive ion channel family protein [Veillonellaceae bacterium]|nr:mechanosensitive ion channel family protein [Veillonellaceae bacterium]
MYEYTTPDFWIISGNKAIRIILIILVASIFLKVLNLIVSRVFFPNFSHTAFRFDEKRARTFSQLFQSIARYIIYFFAIILILQEFHIDTTSLIAGAGIIGLAVGIGAQSLIRDFVTGFFVILEDQYAVGDYVVIGDMAGIVEEIGFRVTKLRDGNGVLHIIPHGAITRISNHTRGHMVATVNVSVSYQADIDKVLALLNNACSEIEQAMPEVLEGPKVVGVVDLRPGEVIIRITAKTVPLQQTKVETALRYKIKLLFDDAAIPLPTTSLIR